MARYPLPRAHAAALRSGRQTLTLAAPRVMASGGHAVLGGAVHLGLAASADEPAETLGQRPCILRGSLVITADALVRIIDLTFHERGEHSRQAERLAAVLRAAEQGGPYAGGQARLAVARLAGFKSWQALFDWNSHRDRRGRPDADGRVVREIIGWAK